MNQDQKHYFAFISHSSADEKIAKWLCRQLEGYYIPTSIQKEYHTPKKLKPIFLYEIDLSKNVLKRALESELIDSQYLIVICSPRAAKSTHVNDEVLHFINSGRYDKIIPFIIDGIPFASLKGDIENECFPKALVTLKGTEQELRGIDIREEQKHRGSKKDAVIDVIATMLGVRLDILKDRYAARRKVIIRSICAMTLLFVISSIGIAAHIYNLHYSQIVNESVSISNNVLENLYKGNIFSAEVLAIDAYETYPKTSNTEKALRAVYDSIFLYKECNYKLFETIHYDRPPRIVRHLPSKNCFIVVCETKIYVYNAQNCKLEHEMDLVFEPDKIEFSYMDPNIFYLYNENGYSVINIQLNQVIPYRSFPKNLYRVLSISDQGGIFQNMTSKAIELINWNGTIKQSMHCGFWVNDAVYNMGSNCLMVKERGDFKKKHLSYSIYDCLSGKCLLHEEQRFLYGAHMSFNLSGTKLYLCKYDSIISYDIKNKDKVIRSSHVNRSQNQGTYSGNDKFIGEKDGNIIISTWWGYTIDSIKAHDSYIRDLSISPDQNQIITCCDEESDKYDYTVKVWQRKYLNAENTMTLGQNYISCIDQDNCAYTLFASKGYNSEKIGTFIIKNNKFFRYRDDITSYENPIFLNDGKHILYRKTRCENPGIDARIFIYKWDYISDIIVDSMDVSNSNSNHLLASSNGKYFVYYGSHYIYLVGNNMLHYDTICYTDDNIRDLAFSTNSENIAILFRDSIVVYNVENLYKRTSYLRSFGNHICMNNDTLYVADYSELYMVDRNTNVILKRIDCKIGIINEMLYDEKSKWLFVRGSNNEIRLYSSDLTLFKPIHTYENVNSMFCANNQIIVVGTNVWRYNFPIRSIDVNYLYCFCNERFVCFDHQGVSEYNIWGREHAPKPSSIEFEDSDWPISVSMNPYRRQMVINFPHDIKIINIPRNDDENVRILKQYKNDSIRNITFNVDYNVVYYAKMNDNKLYEWDCDLDKHKILASFESNITSLSCSNNYEFTAVGTSDGLYIMDNYSYKMKKIYTSRKDIYSIVLDEKDKRIAVYLADGKIIIMKKNGEVISTINGIAHYSDLISFVGDDQFAANTEYNKLNVYDIASSMIIATYPILYHTYDWETLQYDNNYAIFRLGYRKIKHPTIEEVLSTLKQHIKGRKLSEEEKQKYGYKFHKKCFKWYL